MSIIVVGLAREVIPVNLAINSTIRTVSEVLVADEVIERPACHAAVLASGIFLHAAKESLATTVNGTFHESLDGCIVGAHAGGFMSTARLEQRRWALLSSLAVVDELRLHDPLVSLVLAEGHDLADLKMLTGGKTNREKSANRVVTSEEGGVVWRLAGVLVDELGAIVSAKRVLITTAFNGLVADADLHSLEVPRVGVEPVEELNGLDNGGILAKIHCPPLAVAIRVGVNAGAVAESLADESVVALVGGPGAMPALRRLESRLAEGDIAGEIDVLGCHVIIEGCR